VAATSLAARVAAEKNVSVGGLVGYSVRFDEASSSDTRIKYVSDGMLVRELLSDRLLSRYSVIVVDEAHERTLRTDFLIANLKTIQTARNNEGDVGGKGKGPASALNPLKLIIMSATLDAEKFSKFYNKLVDYFRTRRTCLWETSVLEYSMSRVDNTLSKYFIHLLARRTTSMLLYGRSSKSILIDLQEMSLYFFQVFFLICRHHLC
jgi:ATP-dependent RNA helicase DHX33